MIKSLKVQLKEQLVKDIKSAIDQVDEILSSDSAIYNKFILLKSRYYSSKSEYDEGVMLDNDYRIVTNQIRKALINLIDEISPIDLKNASSKESHITELNLSTKAEKPSQLETPDYKNYKWSEKSPHILETFDGENTGLITFNNYDDQLWSGRIENGVYKLSNTIDDYAVKYHYLNIDHQDMSKLPITVDVKVNSDAIHPNPSCGIIFCFNEINRKYYAFIIGNDKEYKLWLKGDHGYQTIVSGRSTLINSEEYNKLGVIKSGNKIYLFINDHFLKGIEDDHLPSGDSGIIAVGKGAFLFDNLSFYKL